MNGRGGRDGRGRVCLRELCPGWCEKGGTARVAEGTHRENSVRRHLGEALRTGLDAACRSAEAEAEAEAAAEAEAEAEAEDCTAPGKAVVKEWDK